ncbi:MAG: SH3 domain-containing protein [bacterium]|nr:SH3 domain-containing protein [bacterium]
MFYKLNTDTKQNIVIGALAVFVLLSHFSRILDFLSRLNPMAGYQQKINETERRMSDAEKKAVLLEFDRIRLEDANNILLAIQDYQFEKKLLPDDLTVLKEQGYLDQNSRLIDPSTKLPYFYKKRDDDFVLCIWLLDKIKGVNTADCPSESSASVEPQISPATQVTGQKVRIVGDGPVNMRSRPSLDAEVIGKINPGDTYIFIEQKNEWYRIRLANDEEGWVYERYIRILPAD